MNSAMLHIALPDSSQLPVINNEIAKTQSFLLLLADSEFATISMKPHILIILALIIGFLESCKDPIKEFNIDSDVQHITLKLYADSTFIEKVEGVEDSYEYSGHWKGSLQENSFFTTRTTNKGLKVLTITPTKTYRIHNGNAILIDNSSKKSLGNVKKLGTDPGWLLTDFLDFKEIKQVKIHNVNGPHYLNKEQWRQIKSEFKKAKSVGGLRCKPSGPCLTFELESEETIQGCVCGDLINFESYFRGSFRIKNYMNFHDF